MEQLEAVVSQLDNDAACEYLESLLEETIKAGEDIEELVEFSDDFGDRTGCYPQWIGMAAAYGNAECLEFVTEIDCSFEAPFWFEMLYASFSVSENRMAFALDHLEPEDEDDQKEILFGCAYDSKGLPLDEIWKKIFSLLMLRYGVTREELIEETGGSVEEWLNSEDI